MKVYLKHNNLYWTGSFSVTKDEIQIVLITSPEKEDSRIFQDEASASEELNFWMSRNCRNIIEFTISVEDEKPRRFCDPSYLPPFRDGCYESYDRFMARKKLHSSFEFSSIPNSAISGTLKYELPKPRTISEICIEADNNKDNENILCGLIYEINIGILHYSEPERNFAIEHIENYLSEITRVIKKEKLKRYFEED